ncbi:MAG: imidazolonepropionase [bacterium]|nr:MAG: imidazolonepropionase [bacterium]
MPEIIDLLLRGAVQLLTCRSSDGEPKRGAALSNCGIETDAAVAVVDGKILAVGGRGEVERAIGDTTVANVIDVEGRVVLPAWVDPHTHAVFSKYRPDEYEARIRGESYLEIARKGGGIVRTVREVRDMDEDQLFEVSRRRLLKMQEQGTTTIEIKSGYGLDTENELKMLRVIARLGREMPLDVVPTFLGAHSTPPEYARSADYVDAVIEEMIPAVVEGHLAEFIDVFCESGVFDLEDTKRIFEEGQRRGLGLKIHADEINSLGGTELAVEMGAVSAEHLIKVSDRGIEMLSRSRTIAVLLPGTIFGLGLRAYAPARTLIDSGAAVALATDFNPGSAPSSSMQLTVALACSQMGMTPAEAINAATINAACAVRRERDAGSLEVGKKADMVVYDIEDYREIPSRAGQNQAMIVLKEGHVVWESQGVAARSEVGF